MPTIISPVITDAGLAAAINASGTGTQLAITHVVLSTDQFSPIPTSTLAVRKEKTTISGGGMNTGAGGFRINCLFTSYGGAAYNATAIGFYAGDPDAGGILFAVYSHPTSVIVNRNALDYVAQYGLQLSRVPTGSVTVTIDPGGAQALALVGAHEVAADPHTQYAPKASPALTGVPTAPTAAPGTNTSQLATTAHVKAADDLKANLASPTFTGTPAAPTAAAGTNSTQLATTAFVTAADALKAPLASPALTGTPTAPTAPAGTSTTQLATTAFVVAADALKANLASPTFTGVPAAPTAAAGTNTPQVSTTAFVSTAVANAVANLLNSAPGALDTLQELAAALGNDANFAATVTSALALKAPLASPALTGAPTAPTAAAGTNTTQLATTAFVQGIAAGRLLAVRVFTASGTYTPTPGTNSIIVEAVGGGGGGGSSSAASSGGVSMAPGGGPGAYGKARFTSGFAGVSMTIGLAGAGAAAGGSSGVSGGTTSFGALLSCPGGEGGDPGTTGPTTATLIQVGRRSLGAPSGANLFGHRGWAGSIGHWSNGGSCGGEGGSNLLGSGGGFAFGTNPGANATTGYGGGGGGAVSAAAINPAAQPGGTATPGVIIVYEFA